MFQVGKQVLATAQKTTVHYSFRSEKFVDDYTDEIPSSSITHETNQEKIEIIGLNENFANKL